MQNYSPFGPNPKWCIFLVPPQLSNPPNLALTQATSVVVTWQPWQEDIDTGDGPVVSYEVQHRVAGTEGPFTTFFTGSATVNSVSMPLERETTYEVVVVASRPGDGGQGPPSPVAIVETRCSREYIEMGPGMDEWTWYEEELHRYKR